MHIFNLLYTKRKLEKTVIIQNDIFITYKELYRRCCCAGELFSQITSSRVGVFIGNDCEYIMAYFSLLYAGKTIIPIDVKINEFALKNIIQFCEIDTIVTIAKNEDYLKSLITGVQRIMNIILIDQVSNEHMIDWNPDLARNEIALLLQTSGTTSMPKWVMLTHKNIITNTKAVCKSLQLKDSDISMIIMPINLSSGHIQFITHFFVGGTIVIYDSLFHAPTIRLLIQKYKVTNFSCVAYMLNKMVEKADYFQELKSLRQVCVGAEKVPVYLINSFMRVAEGIQLVHYYGLSEASPRLTHISNNEITDKVGSVGRPIAGVEIRIIDKKKECDTNEIGEITAHGDNIFAGYFKRPEETAKVLCNGWLYTGDLGYKDADGYLFIVGRKKNIVIVAGNNISPEEIEEVLIQHPYIADVRVYGVQDQRYGERLVAEIMLSTACETCEKDLENVLKNYCCEYLPNHKIPSEFRICDEIPRTQSGKKKRIKVEADLA